MDKTIIKNYGKYLSKVNPEKGRRRAQEQEAKWAEERKKREEEKLTEAYQRELRERAEQAARERSKVEKATAAFNAEQERKGTRSNQMNRRELRQIREGVSAIGNPTTPFRSPEELMAKGQAIPKLENVKPSTRYTNQTAGLTRNTESNRDKRFDSDFDTFFEARYNPTMDYDPVADREVEHWRNLREDIKKKNNWSDKEFDTKWNAYDKERRQKMADEEVSGAVELGKKSPILGSLLQAMYTPQSMIEGGASLLSNLAPDKYKAQAADDPLLTGTRAKAGAKQAVKDEHIKSGIGQGAYDIATGLGDMAIAQAIPVLGTAALGASTAAESNMRALERGIDPNKAAKTAGVAGVTSGLLNKFGLDAALGSEAETALKTIGKAAFKEGAENVLEDVVNLAADKGINREKSQLDTMHDYYVGQGMSDNDAWKKVALDTTRDLGVSAASGAAFGGLMSAAGNIPRLKAEFDARKMPALDEAQTTDIPKVEETQKNLPDVMRNIGGEVNRTIGNSPKSEVNAGRATHIMSPYNGVKPIQTATNDSRFEIPSESFNSAEMNILSASAGNSVGSRKSALKSIYSKLFPKGKAKDVTVNNVTIDGTPYTVRINKNIIAETLHKNPNDPQVIAVLNHLEDIVRESDYIDSGAYANHGGKYKNVERYDYLERPIRVGGRDYICTMDVQVEPKSNNLHKYAVMDEINLVPEDNADTDLKSAASSERGNISNSNIPNPGDNVNSASTLNAPKEELGFDWSEPENPNAVNTDKNTPNLMLDDEGIPKRRRGVDVGQDIDASISLRNNANMDAGYMNDRLESSPYISKTRTNTIQNSGINTQDELDNVVKNEYFERWSRPWQGVYEAAKANVDNNFDDLVRKYTSNYEIKPKLEKLSNDSKGDLNTIRSDQNIDEMFLVYSKLTQEARQATDPEVKRNLQQKALKVAINVTDAQAENARGLRAQAKWAGTPEQTIITAQGYAGKKVEKALDREPRLAGQIEKTAGEIEDWLDQMDVDALNRDEVEDMVRNAIKKRDRLKKRVTKEDIGKITDAIMDQKQYADVQRQLEFLSTGFKEVDAETLDKVSDIFERASALNYGSRERVKLENEGYATLAQAIAPEGRPLKEKIDAMAYFMMLHRIPTTLRNMKGNIAFGQGIMSLKNGVGAIIEAAASKSLKKQGLDRTKSLSILNVKNPETRKMIADAYKFGIDNDYRYMQGGKWETNVGDEINKAIPVYNTKKKTGRIANKLTGGLNDFLEMQDVASKEVKYATSLAGYLKANGADRSIFTATDDTSKQLLQRARDYALKQADEATFHQANETAERTSNFIRSMREANSPVSRTIGDALHTLQPFIKTPANILKTIGEYRPGLLHRAAMDVYALKKGAKNGKPFNATDFIDDMSKGITGTGAALVGAWLAREGIVRIGYDRSDKEASYDNQMGKKQMAINVNGDWVDIANSVPTSGPLIIGAAMYEAAREYMGGDEDEALNALFNGIGAVGNSVIETTMLKGISDFIDALRYSESGAGKVLTAVESIANSRINQLVPADGAALNRSIDPTSYDTYSQYKGMVGTIDRQLKSLQKKIPFSQQIGQSLEQSEIPFLQKVGDRLTLEPYIDVKGNVATNRGDNVAERLFNNFVNPYSVSTDTTDEYDTERERLAKTVGDESILPHISTSSESKLNGAKMSDKDWTTYKQTRGQSREELQHLAIDSDFYKSASDAEKAKLLKDIDTWSVTYGKSVLGGEIKGFDQEVADAYKKGNTKEAFDLMLGKTLYSSAGVKSNSKVTGMITDAVNSGDIELADRISKETKAIIGAGFTPEVAAMYQGAKQKLPELTTKQFTDSYKAVDADGNGSLKQDEIIDAMNKDKKNAKKIQSMFWESDKTLPVLVDGKYQKKSEGKGKSKKSAGSEPEDKAEWVRRLNSGEGDIDALIEQNGYKNHVADLYSAAKKRNPNITADEYISAFKAADTNGNGGVTQAEIKDLMKRDPQNADRYYAMLWSDKWKRKLK